MTNQRDQHIWYREKMGILGGILDVDDGDGFGPEVITFERMPAGTYTVYAHHYSRSMSPTVANIQVRVNGQATFSGSGILTSQQTYAAFTVTVQEQQNAKLKLVGVNLNRTFNSTADNCADAPNPAKCGQYEFTTLAGENSVSVRTEADPSVDANTIKYRVSNVTDGTSLNLTSTSGSNLVFFVSNRGVSGYTDPRFIKPILYEVVAYLDSGEESDPLYIAQDIKSQIRQEYIDKRRFFPAFARETVAADEIGDGSYYGPTFLTNPFADASHDYARYGLTIIKKSRSYFDRVNAAGIPARLTSHWRNPRFNDSLGASNDSELNSYHQSGDAIDINPYREEEAWPTGARNYEEARAMILDAAALALPEARVIPHGFGQNKHVHIQPN